MKLSGNKFIETIMEQKAKTMVERIEGEIPLTPFIKDPKTATYALLTTAGVHLKTEEPFEVVEGDHTVRFIPVTSTEEQLMISHEHFDREDADLDINCVFPLTRLKEIKNEGLIGNIASTHYGLMGFIPNKNALIKETIPKIIEQLKKDQVDALLLNPG